MALDEIRKQIDRVDGEMKSLFRERMSCSEQVACEKAATNDCIYKPDREQAVIERQCADMDPALLMEYRAFLRRTMEISRKYQYGRTLAMRGCFPFPYVQKEPPVKRICVTESELFLCAAASGQIWPFPLPADQITTAESFEELGRMLTCGKADTGLGIMETIGEDVSGRLNSLLVSRGLYIHTCEVITLGDRRLKAAAFSDRLYVLPGHNRVKIVFVCPNRSGSLASVLAMIADYGVNLTEIHSVPFRTGDDWNYRFFAELGMNMLQEDMQALLFQLFSETTQMQLLGSYKCEGDL